MNRSSGPNSGPRPNNTQATNNTTQPKKKSRFGKSGEGDSKLMRIVTVVLLFSVTILLIFLTASFVLGPKNERNYINDDRLQAVFLNGGQVYFGKIADLNDKYLRMTDVFYLRVNQTVQPNQQQSDQQQSAGQNDISLVKLGCELHRPANEMLINRDQVVFWENLKNEAGENTVPGAVANYAKQYPNGQECQSANAGAQNTNQTTTQPTTNNNQQTNEETTGTGTDQ